MGKVFDRFKVFVVMILMLTIFLPSTGESAYVLKQSFAQLPLLTAGEALAIGNVVCIKDSDGYVYKADANDASLRPAVGIVGATAASGGYVKVVAFGTFAGWSSLQEGLPVYLSETAGAATQTAPSYAQKIGVAVTSTTYSFMFEQVLQGTLATTLTLDDGSGASPSFIMTDATDESATFSKVDAGFLTITTVAGDGIQVTTGNLKVGNGTPGVTQDGKDFYVEGTSELTALCTSVGGLTLDDGSGASPSLTLTDATDETVIFNKADAGYMSVTTVAGDGVQITTGNLKVGNGTPAQTLDGEDFYCEGLSEFAGSMYLDDGVGASPSLTLTDATDETAAFSKADAGYLSLTTVAGDGFNVLTGNLKIGNGTPAQTLDGEDLYCEGLSEFAGNMYLDDGTGASPSLTLTDATDETAIFSKADTGYLSITTTADDGVNVLTGNLKIGNGTPIQTINGEDLYVEGLCEIAGVLYASGGIQYEGSDDASETTIAFADPSGDRTITFPDYSGGVPVVVSQDMTSHSANNTTTDGTSVTIPAGVFAAGKSMRFTLSGTCVGANAAKSVILYIDNAAILTLTTDGADVGDWQATFIMAEHTDLAHQKVMGTVTMGDGVEHITDYATDTTDFSGAITVKTQVVSGNAGDTIVQEMGIVEFLP